MHSGEINLRRRASEIGLTPAETDTLCDLLGWNDPDGSLPQSALSLKIQTPTSEEHSTRRARMTTLFCHLIGDGRIAEIRQTPDILRTKYKLSQIGAAWITFEANIAPDPKILEPMRHMAPEQYMREVVVPALSILITEKSEKTPTKPSL